MQYQIHYLAALSNADTKLDELGEEYGDLPDKVKEAKRRVDEAQAIVDETQNIITNVKQFTSNSKTTLQELRDKEEKLSKQQFQVRNNKEFDAITKEIEHIRQEHNKLIDELRTVGIKEENLLRMVESQKKEYQDAAREYEEIKAELDSISNNQDEEVKELQDARQELIDKIIPSNMVDYQRIREFHSDAVVKIRRNSCSGCFSSIPPQKIVEIRNNLDKIYHCENCGRIVYPEEIEKEVPTYL